MKLRLLRCRVPVTHDDEVDAIVRDSQSCFLKITLDAKSILIHRHVEHPALKHAVRAMPATVHLLNPPTACVVHVRGLVG
jgi:hypothetical protein